MTAQMEIQLIAVIVAVSCSIPGVFLVLRKMSMMSDAITHTILLGIVIGFFISHDMNSPVMIIGAVVVGVITVYLVELLNSTKLLSEDSAIGVVFPLLFSIAIILISKYAGSVHLDLDSVLLGELAFAPFNPLIINRIDIGAKAIYTMGLVLIINIALVIVFFKELKLVTFDKELAAALGFSPILIHYGLMSSVSLTAVTAFEAVGSILVIAFMIGPPVSAYLLTDDLKQMIIVSSLIGVLNGILGYKFSVFLDVSIAGSMAMVTGLTFILILILAPKRGIVTVLKRQYYQKKEFAQLSMLIHISNHENTIIEEVENGVDTIREHLNWDKFNFEKIKNNLLKKNYIFDKGGTYILTDEGHIYTKESYNFLIMNNN